MGTRYELELPGGIFSRLQLDRMLLLVQQLPSLERRMPRSGLMKCPFTFDGGPISLIFMPFPRQGKYTVTLIPGDGNIEYKPA
jgi:hypothetical protein